MPNVSDHYTQGTLEQDLLKALVAAGKDPDHLTIEDLAPLDEFHVGGRPATEALAGQMDLRPGLRVLDIGSGIGGPARFLARRYGCSVTGIDLTEEYVRVASGLTARVGLADLVEFRPASATALLFDDASFDRAYIIHVGMNIEDKSAAFAEVRRVLKPSGLFAIYDILRSGPGDFKFPVPWASSLAISFVAPIGQYRDGLQAAGFTIVAERDRRAFAIEFLQQARPATLRPVMGQNAAEKVGNVASAIAEGIISPVEIIARADTRPGEL